MDNNSKEQTPSNDDMFTVGLGASAGGLDALKEFFGSLPQETGMAFVVIMHLSPDHDSNLAELLQSQTSLNVVQVTEDVEMEPDHVYVIPPGKLLEVQDNQLVLSEPEKEHGLASIDLFFR
jgi:two-component system CheB/CheR fusion protein